MEKYEFPFERLKHILGKDFHSPEEKAKLAAAEKKKKEEEAKKKLD